MAGETQLGIAQVTVRAGLDQLGKDLESGRAKVESAMAKIQKDLQPAVGIGKDIAKGIAVGTTAIIGLGVTAAGVFAKMAIDAMPLEQVRGAFAGISGGADEMLKRLQEGSLGMVTNTDLMKSYNTAAQLVGKTFADQLPDAMGYLSKVSAATGQDMGFMLDSLVKGVGRLSPMILDNLGIQVTLADATERAAQMYGKEAEELSKTEIQAGMMNVVLEKLAKNTEKMPEVAGSAAQKWGELKTSMQNIKDDVGVALIPVLEKIITPLGDLAKEHLPKLTTFMTTTFIPTLDKVIYLFSGIGDLVKASGGDWDAFTLLLEGRLLKIADVLGLPMDKVRPLLDGIGEIARTIGAFVTDQLIPFVTTHGPQLKQAFEIVALFLASSAIASTIVGIGSAIAGLLSPISLVLLAVAGLALAWTNDWGGIREKTAEYVGKITADLDKIRDSYNRIRDAIQGLIDKWREWQGQQSAANEGFESPVGPGAGAGKGTYYGGGYAGGGDFTVRAPTMILTGEAYQPERVTVTPLNAGAQADGESGFHFHYYDYSGVNYNRAQSMAREWEYKYEMGLYGK